MRAVGSRCSVCGVAVFCVGADDVGDARRLGSSRGRGHGLAHWVPGSKPPKGLLLGAAVHHP